MRACESCGRRIDGRADRRWLAVAIVVGLALLSGAIVYHGHNTSAESDESYADAEEIIRAYTDARGIRIVSVRHLTGPFSVIKREDGQCALIDVSTQYEGESIDAFWIAGTTGESKSLNC